MRDPSKRVIVALDNMSYAEAIAMAQLLQAEVAGVKIGLERLYAEGVSATMDSLACLPGPEMVPVFADFKPYDIANTVSKAMKNLARLGPQIINVPCLGGRKMLMAARKAVDDVWENDRYNFGLTRKPLLVGVTILTSLGFEDLREIGLITTEGYAAVEGITPEIAQAKTVRNLVVKLALLAKSCGLDGAVAGAHEALSIHAACGSSFKIITPGIRLAGAAADDQVRIATPSEAIAAGADYLVIGRPITEAKDPLATLQLINQQVAEALAQQQEGVARYARKS
ncbi:MAG: orotidine-5'-phosphate decarboxylase [Patescibacteria group bacterium]